jgi:ABC-type nickel/cobalt efflux system permease component RcnA
MLTVVLAAWLLAPPPESSAHPLGNFSINHYAALHLRPDAVDVRYVVDMAEIPTFQEIQDTGIAPEVGHPKLAPYLERQALSLKEQLSLTIDGRRASLDVVTKDVIFPPGAGGLPTMKIGVLYRARLDGGAGPHNLSFEDNTFPGRAGWKEIIAVGAPGVSITSTTAPATDRSRELSDYPTDLLNSPPQDVAARVVFARTPAAPPLVASASPPTDAPPTPATSPELRTSARAAQTPARAPSHAPEAAPPIRPSRGPVAPEEPDRMIAARAVDSVTLAPNRQTRSDAFTALIESHQRGLGIVFLALVVAAGLGAFHALEPGHGKTIVAAYLVGARGTAHHAVFLGCIVTASHTLGVYLLGVVTLYASRYVLPERLYPWLGVLSGITIAGLGFFLFLRRYAGREPGHGHAHGEQGAHALRHHHPHDHTHSHHARADHAHPHAPSIEHVTLRELFALGITGGLVPCPAALVVLLSALSLGRVGFGLLLIVAFSIGLAAVLIAIGLLMVYARRLMSRVQGEGAIVTRWLPLTSAAVMTVLGLAIAVQALMTAGIVHVKL